MEVSRLRRSRAGLKARVNVLANGIANACETKQDALVIEELMTCMDTAAMKLRTVQDKLESSVLTKHVSWPANTLAVANHRGARERIAVHVSLPSVHGDSLRPKCSPAKVFAGQSVAGQRVPRRTDAHGDSLRGPHGDSLRPRW
uniref:Uncharacterized protein n=1 Tax=Trichuris muris TaxID=70415 RepID=A0A5S6R671_TRIMR